MIVLKRIVRTSPPKNDIPQTTSITCSTTDETKNQVKSLKQIVRNFLDTFAHQHNKGIRNQTLSKDTGINIAKTR